MNRLENFMCKNQGIQGVFEEIELNGGYFFEGGNLVFWKVLYG